MACKRTILAFAATALSCAALLTIASTTETSARAQVRDNRGGVAQPDRSGPGHAIQGTRIKCVIPFCGHDFNPSRARVQDHRTPPNRHSPPNRPPKT